jgi:hypothetical protein
MCGSIFLGRPCPAREPFPIGELRGDIIGGTQPNLGRRGLSLRQVDGVRGIEFIAAGADREPIVAGFQNSTKKLSLFEVP